MTYGYYIYLYTHLNWIIWGCGLNYLFVYGYDNIYIWYFYCYWLVFISKINNICLPFKIFFPIQWACLLECCENILFNRNLGLFHWTTLCSLILLYTDLSNTRPPFKIFSIQWAYLLEFDWDAVRIFFIY